MMKFYTVSPTFTEVLPIYLTQEEFVDMVDDNYAIFTDEEEAKKFLEEN